MIAPVLTDKYGSFTCWFGSKTGVLGEVTQLSNMSRQYWMSDICFVSVFPRHVCSQFQCLSLSIQINTDIYIYIYQFSWMFMYRYVCVRYSDLVDEIA